MRLTVWFGCVAVGVILVAVHLVACREDRPAVLVSLGASLVVLYGLRRAGVTANPGRAAALALSPEADPAGGDAWARPGEDQVPAGMRRSATVLVVILVGGVCALATLGSGWLAFRAQAESGSGSTEALLEARP